MKDWISKENDDSFASRATRFIVSQRGQHRRRWEVDDFVFEPDWPISGPLRSEQASIDPRAIPLRQRKGAKRNVLEPSIGYDQQPLTFHQRTNRTENELTQLSRSSFAAGIGISDCRGPFCRRLVLPGSGGEHVVEALGCGFNVRARWQFKAADCGRRYRPEVTCFSSQRIFQEQHIVIEQALNLVEP